MPARSPKRVTATDVALRAGVSVATVSLVVNGKAKGRVSPTLTERVLGVVSELGYVVDESASSLSSGSSRVVLFVAPDLTSPFFGAVISGVQEALGERYQLYLAITETGQRPRAVDVRQFGAIRLAGILVGAPSPGFVSELHIPVPTVLVDSVGEIEGFPSVNLDISRGARELARHLASHGHRTIAYLDNMTGSATFEVRRAAFAEEAGILGMAVVRPLAYSTLDVDEAARVFEERWPDWSRNNVTAVVCGTDVQAYGVLMAARSLALRVPEQIAVAGFDDLPYSRLTRPALTTVALPGRQLGLRSGSVLRRLVEDGHSGESESLPSRLVIRDSSALRP